MSILRHLANNKGTTSLALGKSLANEVVAGDTAIRLQKPAATSESI